MTRLWAEGEAVQVELDQRGWPACFRWQGQLHPVQHIWQRWHVDTDWWADAGRVWREYIALTTQDGLLCVLYFDLTEQVWRLSRVYD